MREHDVSSLTAGELERALEGAWHRALDHPDERDAPKRKVTTGADADPWATDGPGGYSDEPPF